MIVSLLALFFPFCALMSYAEGQCPADLLPPCTCAGIGFHSSVITCKKATNEHELKRSIYGLKGKNIRTMNIFESHFSFLPHDVFEGVEFQRLFMAECTMTSLSDQDEAFLGLEDSLEEFVVHDTTFLTGWKWSHFKNLKKLKELRAVKAGPVLIDEDIKDIAHLNLTYLLFMRDSLSYVHDTAFSSFENLQVLSLKENLISQLKRSMFPNPANKLKTLIFSDNKLKSLPEDIFTNMPALISIVLADNELLTLPEGVFKPVWSQLRGIDVLGNDIRCDCRIKWMMFSDFPLDTWIKCAEPPKLKNKDVINIDVRDLFC